jgi:putative GTP pyrophosphokinase
MKDAHDQAAAIREFESRRALYEAFTSKLHSLLDEVLRSKNADILPIEYRTKTVESFEEKLTRGGKLYSDPVAEITDLSGLRIIGYSLQSIPTIETTINELFDVDLPNSVDKTAELKAHEFGYRSKHFVVSFPLNRCELPEYQRFRSLKAEIQVRTVLQHAWAVMDHKLRYKGVADAPAQLARRLFRLSGLLELADDEFAALRNLSEAHREAANKSVAQNLLEIPIDADSIRAYFDSSSTAIAIEEVATGAGFGTSKGQDETTITLLANLSSKFRLESIHQLDQILQKALSNPQLPTYFSVLIKEMKSQWFGFRSFFGVLAFIFQCIEPENVEESLGPWVGQLRTVIRAALEATGR